MCMSVMNVVYVKLIPEFAYLNILNSCFVCLGDICFAALFCLGDRVWQ